VIDEQTVHFLRKSHTIKLMAKQKNFQKNPLAQAKQNKWLTLTILVFIIFLALAVHHKIVVAADKKKFEQARMSLESLYSDIVAQVGTPERVERVNSCGYGNREFDRGPLGCSVTLQLTFVLNDSVQASHLASQVDMIASQKSRTFKSTYSNSSSALPFNGPQIDISGGHDTGGYIDLKSMLSCATNSYFDKSSLLLHTELSCGGSAKAPYYKVNP
jgi:hypothetical protein